MPGPERTATPEYVPADLVVLRAALAPRAGPGAELRGGVPDLRGPEDPQRLHEAIRAFADDQALAAALELASPALAQALTRPWPENAARRPVERQRMTIALTGYLLRLRHRATPFGLFAGTALIPAATEAGGGIGTRHRLLLRPSPRWLADLVAALESDPGLPGQAPQVRIAAPPSLRRVGAWYVLIDHGAGGPGEWRAKASVRRTSLLDAVVAVAAGDRRGDGGIGGIGGIGYATLLDLLCAAAPGADREPLARYVAGLLTAGLLVTDLLPAPGDADPVRHLIERLGEHPIAERLRDVHRDLGQPPPTPRPDDLRRLRAGLRAVQPGNADLVADALLDTDLRLPRAVVVEVARAASVAWTCAPPEPARVLAGLHQAILRRYGIDRPVPLAELLDPTESLGLADEGPAARPPASPAPPPAVGGPVTARAGRNRLLAGLALTALADGHAELLLDRPLRRRIAELAGAHGSPPPVDVVTQIVAASAAALNQGDYLVVLGSRGGPGPAGALAGRLACQLGDGVAQLTAPAAPSGEAGPLDVEVVFRPPDPAAANLISETGWTAFRIDLTEHPPRRSSRDITLADLVVIATPERLRLHSERLGRDIRPVSFSALHPGQAGAVPGLLLALGRHGAVPWKSWDWGAVRSLPWLPRVRVGRAVLAPARWRVPPNLRHLAEVGTDRQWHDGLLRWRDADAVPDVVVAGAWDQQLPLDLADPVHAALLRRECLRRDVVAVREPPGGLPAWRGAGWPSGPSGTHTAEIVISLHPRQTKPQADRTTPQAGRTPPQADRTTAQAGWTTAQAGRTTPQARQTTPQARQTTPQDGRTTPQGRQTTPQADRTTPPAGDFLAPADGKAAASVFLPGGDWLCATLAGPAALQDFVLAELADEALRAAAEEAAVDRWFFVKTADPTGVPHVVLRFHGPARGLNAALLPALHMWSGRLRTAGLVREFSLVSYWPELWRYGGASCMEATERFFHSDSLLCLQALASMSASVRVERLAAPGVLHILAVMLGSLRAVSELPPPRLSAPDRRLIAQLSPALRESHAVQADRPPEVVPSHEHEQEARSAWHAALAAYQSQLSDAGQDRASIAWSLVHMHCNRLAGPDRAVERVAVALARDLAITRSTAAG